MTVGRTLGNGAERIVGADWHKPKRSVILPLPTVLRHHGFRIVIYVPPREHGPAHVHVFRTAGEELVIWLGDASTGPSIGDAVGMRDADAVKAFRVVEAHHAFLLACWRAYHG
ncbi:DUF4160 domain-containing protein [Gemmatimonas sp.]|jgi:hypothetical protein|uniref:DUF4160 domain-containing protein n=1 Tax=Gemmatimonas sp. TaxID=1962908 RepID=UPI0031B7FAE6